jgi:sialate O-acetylesterase
MPVLEPPRRTPLPATGQTLGFRGLLGDHMVLQRREPIVLRGTARPGGMVDVGVGKAVTRVESNGSGFWKATLPAQEAGGPFRITATCGRERIVLEDVLVGEVWLCAGQSNMDWRLGDTRDGAAALAAAERHPDIRLLVMPRPATAEGEVALRPAWQVGSRDSAAAFSAVGYQFGLRLRRDLGVPIGLIDAARGGTRIHAWTPLETLAEDAEWKPRLVAHADRLSRSEELQAEHAQVCAAWSANMPPGDPGIAAEAAGWADPALDDGAWGEVDLPCWWQRGGHDASGVLWYRRTVDIPASAAAAGLRLHLGACDKADRTWVNGHLVGGIPLDQPDGWRTPRIYAVPPTALRPGRNVIAVRAVSNLNQGGLTGPAPVMRLEGGGWSLPLSGRWRWRIERDLGRIVPPPAPWGPRNLDSPGILWERLVAPACRQRIAGVIWYQGESDEYGPEAYRRLFPAMIRAWRRAWDHQFPFLFVQLPGFGSPVPPTTLWAELREAQAAALALPRTAMVPTIDIGDPNDLHPQNKAEVGRRLALAALATAYDRDEPGLLAPCFASASREGGTIRVELQHGEAGLRLLGGRLRGFEVAGEDHCFVPAEAQVDGLAVQVWSARVPAPCRVRYAWADLPMADVCTPAGLPLAPFAARAAG